MSPPRDPKYLAWIRTLPCLVCGSSWKTEAAHTGSHGMAQKSSDRSCIPLCARHHRTGNDSYHKLGARAFEEKHMLNLRSIVDDFNEKPHIRVENGAFVAHCGSERYLLGPVGIGVRSAVRKAVSFWCEQVGDRNFAPQALIVATPTTVQTIPPIGAKKAHDRCFEAVVLLNATAPDDCF